MNRRETFAVGAGVLLVLCFGWPRPGEVTAATVQAAAAAPGKVGPDRLYPDPDLTPGKAATLKLANLTARYTANCPSGKASCTYSESHRNVPDAVHKQVYDEYKVPANARNIQDGEVDHLFPMCAGGSNDIHNLWYQPAKNEWNGKNFGYHEKDNLEKYICKQIVARKLAPAVAYNRIREDWVGWYLELHLDKKAQGEDEDVN